jgi:cell wall-associated NlpC family hydrolase
MKPQKRTFTDITASFLGKPYSEYGKGPDSYGCIGLCYAFLKEIGKIPDESVWEYQELNINNFMEVWKENRGKAEQLMIEAAERIGTDVTKTGKLAGDLLILKTRTGSYFPGIYVGNGHVLASYADLGVRIFGIDNEGITVIKARRL